MPEGNQTPFDPAANQKSSRTPVGPTVGIVIIVLLLLAAAAYFLVEELNRPDPNPPSYIPGDQV